MLKIIKTWCWTLIKFSLKPWGKFNTLLELKVKVDW